MPNGPWLPLGISSEPAPEDVPGINSIPIGDNDVARIGRDLSYAAAKYVELLNLYNRLPDFLKP